MSPRSARTRCSCTTSTHPTRVSRSRCRGSSHSPTTPTPVGVFRDVDRAEFASETSRQLMVASEKGPGDLGRLLASGGTWEVN